MLFPTAPLVIHASLSPVPFRLRIAQEIQREQEEIEVQLKDLEARGVLIEKALRGEGQNFDE